MLTRRPGPTTTLVLGLICAVAAGACWAFSTTVSDRATVLDEAYTIAKSEPVREEFAWQIADAIVPHSATSSPAALTLSNDLARKVVESSAFQRAFVTALPAIYDQVVHGTPGDVIIDPALLHQAFTDVGGTEPPNLSLTITSAQVPELRAPIDLMHNAASILGALAALLIGFGLAMAPHRGRAVMRIGRWLITTGLVTVALFWAVPTLALLPLGGWIGVIGTVLATGDWLVLPASVLAAFGVAILVMGRAGEAESRRSTLSVIPTPTARVPKHRSIN